MNHNGEGEQSYRFKALPQHDKSMKASAFDTSKLLRKDLASSLSPWVGRGRCILAPQDYPKMLHPERKKRGISELGVSSILRYRQGLLNDCKLIEQLLHFCNIILMLVKEESMITTNNNSLSEGEITELKKIYKIPNIVIECCLIIQDLIDASTFNNRRIAVKILSISGTLLSMISQVSGIGVHSVCLHAYIYVE
jgi:hypothetical protein